MKLHCPSTQKALQKAKEVSNTVTTIFLQHQSNKQANHVQQDTRAECTKMQSSVQRQVKAVFI